MICYRRKGGFLWTGDLLHDDDRVRVHDDERVEYVKVDGSVVPCKDAAFVTKYARACVGDGLWVVCEDEPFDRSKR